MQSKDCKAESSLCL